MARTTKLELEQQLIASQRDNAALRLALSEARANVESLRTQYRELSTAYDYQSAELAETNTEREALRQSLAVTRIERNHLQGQVNERKVPAHFAAARELAMRTGRCVKVGA